MQLSFLSSLPASYYDALERLVFFNPLQSRSEPAIVHALDLYGTPRIVADAAGLRVTLSGSDQVQCLFGMVDVRGRSVLAGMVMYLRTSREELVVVHLAVSPRYGRTKRSGLGVVIRLMRAVRAAAHRLRGVERITVLYSQNRQFRVPINKSSDEVVEPLPDSGLPRAS
jgi:hypothetical protein